MQKKYHFYLYITILSCLSLGRAHGQATTGSTGGTTSGKNGLGANDTVGIMLSLPQAVSIAIKNNLSVNTYDLTMQQDKVNLAQQWGNLLPTINASAGQSLGFGRVLNPTNYQYVNQQTTSGNYSISAGLPIFQGFYLQNNIRAYKYYLEAGKMDLQNQKDFITLSIIQAYLLVLSSQDQLAITREQANTDSVQVARYVALYKEGGNLTGALSDLPTLQGQYAGDMANIAAAVNTLELARVNLFNLLNVPYKRDVEFDRSALAMQLSDYQQSSDSIYQSALNLVPSVKAADLRVKSYQKLLAANRGLYYPSISFSSSINTYYNNATPDKFGTQFNNNQYTSLGLTLSIPILNRFSVRNNVKLAKINLKQAEYNTNNTKLVLQQNVETAYQNMILAYNQYKSYMDQTTAYAESFRITATRFDEGVINVNADLYVQAKARADQSKLSLAVAKYTFIFRTKVLDYYQGKLSL